MSAPCSCNSRESEADDSADATADGVRVADHTPATEMSRVLRTAPIHLAADPSGGAIAHWNHGPLHDVVEPMTDHVVMAYNGTIQRMERRSGRSVESGTFRRGVVIIIPAGSSSRWDIPKPVDVVQLYLPHTTLTRIAEATDTFTPTDLLERTAHPDPITSRLLLSAADVLEGNRALDTLFRQQLTDLLATRLLAAHTGKAPSYQPRSAAWHRMCCAGPSSDCGPTPMRTSPSPLSQLIPGCHVFISVALSRKARGSHRTTGCVNIGLSKP